MPVDQVPPRVAARSRDDAKIVQYHDFINDKIESTRRMVKFVDLATALAEFSVSVSLFLLLVIVAEHWLVPGGLPSAVRVILFLILAAGSGYFAVRRLWPLCVKAINPVYAAQTIEHGSPTLKNGLINLLLFRERREEISDAVYRTLEEQAAHGLTRVPVDTSVDQTELIRLGYVLIAIVAVAGLYKVFSPKDPFVAAERVLMPWSNILPASRVTISDVKPGTETVSQGEVVEVSAEVHGLNDDDAVVVRYSTEDGQIVGRAISLKLSADKMRFQAKLTDGAEGALGSSVTRNLKYHLEAGDAHSLTYSITVVPAATILVERVDYHYPKYTGLVDQSVDGVGDIRAIEGTKVTIHARANAAIREANVDFDADGRPDLQMATEDAKARVEFELGLREDRQTPKHASYVLRFANSEGRANQDPVKYSINVEPDRQPEAEILLPREKSRDARLDETLKLEIEARDPDFSLSAVRLHGEVSGREVLSESLLHEEHRGPFDGRFALVPAARGLKEGDVLEYWAEADDNRTPKPNTVSTEHKTLRIVGAGAGQQGRDAQNGKQPPQDGGQGQKNQDQQGGQGQKGQQGQQGKSGDQQSGGENGNGQQNGQGQQGQGQGQGEKQQGDKSQSGQSNGDQQSGGGDKSKQSGGLKQNETSSGGGDKANQHDGQGQAGEAGGQSASNDPSSKQPDQQGDKKQTGAGATGGQPSKDGQQPDGARPDANKSQDAAGNKSGSGDQKNGQQPNSAQSPGQQQKGQKGDAQSGENQSAVSSEGDDDAEAFNRIQKRMEKSGELKPGEDSKKEQGDKGQQGDQQQANKENSNGGQQGQSQEDKSGAQGSESQKKDGAGEKKSDSQQGQGANSKPDAKQPGDKGQGEKGQGGQSRQDDSNKQENKQEQSGGESKQGQSTGEGQSSTKGSSGGGKDEKKEGSPNSQPGTKPTETTEQGGSKRENKKDSEPPAGASGKKESDSHGDQGGDKAGRGSEGGGQKSPHDGTGSTGQNQSADTGAGQSGEQGKGDTSNAGGKDAKSDHPTGSSDGKTQGKGSEQRDGAGDKPGGQNGERPVAGGDKSKQEQGGQNGEGMKQPQGDKQGQKQDGNKAENKQSDQQADKKDSEKSNDPAKQKPDDQQSSKSDGGNTQSGSGGSGEPGGAVNPQVSITGEAPEGDAANLDYARKQTDLVVGKLADQLKGKKVDKDLLKELGWSEADLKRFVDRWQQRKAAAEQGNEAGDAAKRDLDDALRSLGLRSGDLQQSAVQKDTMRDLHEGYHGPVPAEYKDRLRAYNQGVSRARAADDK